MVSSVAASERVSGLSMPPSHHLSHAEKYPNENAAVILWAITAKVRINVRIVDCEEIPAARPVIQLRRVCCSNLFFHIGKEPAIIETIIQ
jgi:hypothetical protein|tara:strand:+ start:447 stop:716 length:270 start_codon:yes stop_codon:yes gene_type:complete